MNDLLAHVKTAVLARFPSREISEINKNAAGQMHANYEVVFDDGGKVFYRGYRDDGVAATGKGIYFDDSISLVREVAIMRTLAERTKIPVPQVLDQGENELGQYALLSFLPGIRFSEYLIAAGSKVRAFTGTLWDIGRVLASASSCRFQRFGPLQVEGQSHGCSASYEVYMSNILWRHIGNTSLQQHFSQEEWAEMESGVRASLAALCSIPTVTPQVVVYDLHARNFFVNASGSFAGNLSGVFDVEFAQMAPFEVELACLEIQLFPMLGMHWYELARKTFLDSFRLNGGVMMEGEDHVAIIRKCVHLNHSLSAAAAYAIMPDRAEMVGVFKDWTMAIIRGDYDNGLIVNTFRKFHGVPVVAGVQ